MLKVVESAKIVTNWTFVTILALSSTFNTSKNFTVFTSATQPTKFFSFLHNLGEAASSPRKNMRMIVGCGLNVQVSDGIKKQPQWAPYADNGRENTHEYSHEPWAHDLAVPYWWGATGLKQLSMAAKSWAHLIFLYFFFSLYRCRRKSPYGAPREMTKEREGLEFIVGRHLIWTGCRLDAWMHGYTRSKVGISTKELFGLELKYPCFSSFSLHCIIPGHLFAYIV